MDKNTLKEQMKTIRETNLSKRILTVVFDNYCIDYE